MEWWITYGELVGYESSKFCILGGLTGHLLVSDKHQDIGERTIHNLGIVANYRFGNVRPGIYFKMPLIMILKKYSIVYSGVILQLSFNYVNRLLV
jgi:hypothetical protein